MQCLTPEKVIIGSLNLRYAICKHNILYFILQALLGDCGFMAATLYAKSIFGEDALANLSIEKPFENPNAPVTGHIRIRAKSQVCSSMKISKYIYMSRLKDKKKYLNP